MKTKTKYNETKHITDVANKYKQMSSKLKYKNAIYNVNNFGNIKTICEKVTTGLTMNLVKRHQIQIESLTKSYFFHL